MPSISRSVLVWRAVVATLFCGIALAAAVDVFIHRHTYTLYIFARYDRALAKQYAWCVIVTDVAGQLVLETTKAQLPQPVWTAGELRDLGFDPAAYHGFRRLEFKRISGPSGDIVNLRVPRG